MSNNDDTMQSSTPHSAYNPVGVEIHTRLLLKCDYTHALMSISSSKDRSKGPPAILQMFVITMCQKRTTSAMHCTDHVTDSRCNALVVAEACPARHPGPVIPSLYQTTTLCVHAMTFIERFILVFDRFLIISQFPTNVIINENRLTHYNALCLVGMMSSGSESVGLYR